MYGTVTDITSDDFLVIFLINLLNSLVPDVH